MGICEFNVNGCTLGFCSDLTTGRTVLVLSMQDLTPGVEGLHHHQALVVQRMDNPFPWINHCPLVQFVLPTLIHWIVIYPVDGATNDNSNTSFSVSQVLVNY